MTADDTRPSRVAVRTPSGAIEGVARAGYVRFTGIRYALPPTGPFRFRPPRPAGAWQGVYDATKTPPIAPQIAAPGAAPHQQSEDCLFLNIFTPRPDGRSRPILFWIHGGGYTGGSGHDVAGGSFCRDADIVVVTVNYRLGALGFLPIDAIDPSYGPGAGNNGIRDQLEAIRWLRAHASAFGGDPERITIAGNSAGGGSVLAILAAPDADGLYHQALVQSAPARLQPQPAALQLCNSLVQSLETSHGGDGALDRLLHASVGQLLVAQTQVIERPSAGSAGLRFRPTIDGSFVTRDVPTATAEAARRGVPLMIGTNADEGTFFSDALPWQMPLDDMIGDHLADVTAPERILELHHKLRRPDRSVGEDVHTQATFRIPSLRAADAHAAAGGPTWVYLFTWTSPVLNGRLGATHALEMPFVWDQLDAWGWLVGDDPPRRLAQLMHAMWGAFVRAGEPNHAGSARWPTYGLPRRTTLNLNEEIRAVDDPEGTLREAWYGEPEGPSGENSTNDRISTRDEDVADRQTAVR